MKMPEFTTQSRGRLTVLAALCAALTLPAVAQAQKLVISQVYGAGGNSGSVYSNDFIELFNPGAETVTASGWTLNYASTSGTSWNNRVSLPPFSVEPGKYVLVQLQGAANTGGAPALPGPVLVASTGIDMAGSNGKIALTSDNVLLSGAAPTSASIVDLVGYGTANFYEGSAAAPAASASLALFRANGGCTDTNQNRADFATGAPAPRNAATAANVCGGVGPVDQAIVLTCPASLPLARFSAGAVVLGATDPDSIVNAAVITSAAVPGISLTGFSAAGGAGGTASVSLQADATVALGSHPVIINFSNSTGQQKSCTVNVSVSGPATIPEIQGVGPTSPFNNASVITEGVVTFKVSNGYFLQDLGGDGDPATSDGLFVFTSPAAVNVGDRVRVQGTVTEFKPSGATRTYTELKDVVSTNVLASGLSVTPTNIVFDAGIDLARYEAMLVNVNNALTINQTSYLGERGELTLAVGRREIPTNRYRPGTPEAVALAAANAQNQLILDDGVFVAPAVIPYLGQDGTVRAGDTVSSLTGVLDFGAIGGGGAAFKLHPTTPPAFSRTNPRTAAPVFAAGQVKVASANVLNFFTTFMNGYSVSSPVVKTAGCTVGAQTALNLCRGADNMEEFIRQRDKIVNELKQINADVVGLMEIQNDGDGAVAYLVDQINAAIGTTTYAYVPKPASTGTDAIRVAMIYKPSKVALVGGAMSDADAVNNRPPMAQTFKAANGATFSVIVNHLKSKGGTCGSGGNADKQDGQGCHNLSRVQQATRLASYFIPQVINAAGDPDVLVIGDMNAYGFEDPIHTLTQAGLVNQLERHVRPAGIPHSYVFGGESGYLDHALTTASLDAQVAGAAEWHTNADEPTVIDYNLDGKSAAAQALYTNDAFRSSDHDPVVVALNLTPTFTDSTASFAFARSGFTLNRLTGKYTATITLTNTTGAALTGPFHLQFNGLPAGVTLDGASGMRQGAPYLTLGAGTIAAGAKVTVPLVFSNPGKVAIGYSNVVYSGNF